MSDTKDNCGEGNRAADRRYRNGVRETVAEATHEERARKAERLSGEELDEAREAEQAGKSRRRS